MSTYVLIPSVTASDGGSYNKMLEYMRSLKVISGELKSLRYFFTLK